MAIGMQNKNNYLLLDFRKSHNILRKTDTYSRSGEQIMVGGTIELMLGFLKSYFLFCS